MHEFKINVVGETRTVCFGRFLVDVPNKSTVVFGPAHVPYYFARLDHDKRSIGEIISEKISVIVDNRWKAYDELLAEDSMLAKSIDGSVPYQKIVFGVSNAIGSDYKIESLILLDGELFSYWLNSPSKKNSYEKVVSNLRTFGLNFRRRTDDEVPVIPGLCVDGGFITDNREGGMEGVTLGIRLQEYSDVHLSISVRKKSEFVQSDALPDMIKRTEENWRLEGKGSWFSRVKTLRRGKRSIGAWDGYELLFRKPKSGQEEESHEFRFVSQGKPGDPLLPLLDVEMHTGLRGNRMSAVRASISDEEAIQIWDKLTSSIRVRPVSAIK
ncbi:T6SS immunity protein Tli4 family protein [Oxalobacteraceae bacterium A2-2]